MNLPSLVNLRTFEAVARHMSFQRAAVELHLSPSAVSHQIRALETTLQVKLFIRNNPGIALTGEGRLLLDGVSDGLERIATACSRLHASAGRRVLTVSAPSPVAAYWLAPRLAEFNAGRPTIETRVVALDNTPTLARGGIDLAIVKVRVEALAANGSDPVLMRDQVFPVCRPDLIGGGSLDDPAALLNCTLLQEDQLTTPEIDWLVWLRHLGMAEIRPKQVLHFSHFDLAIRAALNGLGVAIGRSPLLDHELAQGRLIRAVRNVAMAASRVYVLRWPEDRTDDTVVADLKVFLMDAAAGRLSQLRAIG